MTKLDFPFTTVSKQYMCQT